LIRRTERVAKAPLLLVPRLRKNGRRHNCTQLHSPIRLCGVHSDNVSVPCFVYGVVKNALYGDHVYIPSVCDVESATEVLAGYLINSVQRVFARGYRASLSFATAGTGTAVLCPKRSMNFYPRIPHFSVKGKGKGKVHPCTAVLCSKRSINFYPRIPHHSVKGKGKSKVHPCTAVLCLKRSINFYPRIPHFSVKVKGKGKMHPCTETEAL